MKYELSDLMVYAGDSGGLYVHVDGTNSWEDGLYIGNGETSISDILELVEKYL